MDSIACASSARTWAVEYSATGNAMAVIILSARDPPMTQLSSTDLARAEARSSQAARPRTGLQRPRRRPASTSREDEQHLLQLARRRLPRRDALHGSATALKRSRPAELRARHRAGDQRAHGLLAARRRGAADAVLADRSARLRLALRARPRLPQGPARARSQHLADATCQALIGPLGYRVFVDTAPVLENAPGAQCRPRLDRQAHQPDRARCRLVVLPRRDPHRPAAAGRRAGQRALRQLQACMPACPTGAIVAP